MRGPEQHSSPALHGERASSAMASSEDGDRAQLATAVQRQQGLPKRKTGAARRGPAAGKDRSRAAAAADAPSAIRLADPVRCVRWIRARSMCPVPTAASEAGVSSQADISLVQAPAEILEI